VVFLVFLVGGGIEVLLPPPLQLYSNSWLTSRKFAVASVREVLS
jgi:hypothetical protein